MGKTFKKNNLISKSLLEKRKELFLYQVIHSP